MYNRHPHYVPVGTLAPDPVPYVPAEPKHRMGRVLREPARADDTFDRVQAALAALGRPKVRLAPERDPKVLDLTGRSAPEFAPGTLHFAHCPNRNAPQHVRDRARKRARLARYAEYWRDGR